MSKVTLIDKMGHWDWCVWAGVVRDYVEGCEMEVQDGPVELGKAVQPVLHAVNNNHWANVMQLGFTA